VVSVLAGTSVRWVGTVVVRTSVLVVAAAGAVRVASGCVVTGVVVGSSVRTAVVVVAVVGTCFVLVSQAGLRHHKP